MKCKIFIITIILSMGVLARAQTVNLSISHAPTGEEIIYVVDFLQLDRTLLLSIKLSPSEIRQIKTKGSTLIIETKMLVVLDGVHLFTKKEKKMLSTIKKEMVDHIEIIDKKRAVKLYGRKARNGALLIKLTNY